MNYATSPAEEAEAAQDEGDIILEHEEQAQEQEQPTNCLSRPQAPAPQQQSTPQQPQQPSPPPPPPPPCSSASVDHEVWEPEGAAEEADAQGDIASSEDGDRRCADGPPAGHTFNLAGALVPLVAEEPAEDGTPNYYDWKAVFPELEVLLHGMSEIAAECGDVAAWKAWPEKHYGEGGGHDWKVFPFVHTFPAFDESRRTWVESTCARCPTTTALLRRLPNIRTALFSRLGGGSRISGHRGWADLANHVLRCHLPLVVPSDGPCGLWVNGEGRHHAEGDIIVFDDSKLHKAFNESTGDRLVLIVDILRPPGVPLGTADGDHTPELDAFIDAFR